MICLMDSTFYPAQWLVHSAHVCLISFVAPAHIEIHEPFVKPQLYGLKQHDDARRIPSEVNVDGQPRHEQMSLVGIYNHECGGTGVYLQHV